MAKSTEVEWGNPPRDGRGRPPGGGRTQLFVAELKRNPGRWAKYRDDQTYPTISPAYRRFTGIEWTARANGDGTWSIYARAVL